MKHITQSASHDRAQLINTPISYVLFIKEEKCPKYEGILKISITLKTQPSSLLVDYQGSAIHEISVNNRYFRNQRHWNGYTLVIPREFFNVGSNEIFIELREQLHKRWKWLPLLRPSLMLTVNNTTIQTSSQTIAINEPFSYAQRLGGHLQRVNQETEFSTNGLSGMFASEKLKVSDRFLHNLNNSSMFINSIQAESCPHIITLP